MGIFDIKLMFNWINLFIATTFFTGYIPKKLLNKKTGAGTISSLITLAFMLFILNFENVKVIIVYLLVSVHIIALFSIKYAEKFILSKWGPDKIGDKEIYEDFNETNIDEVPGQLMGGLVVYFLPLTLKMQIIYLILSFILFRFYDIFKFGPIKWAEDNLPTPFGVVFDDSIAGIFAGVTLFIIWSFV